MFLFNGMLNDSFELRSRGLDGNTASDAQMAQKFLQHRKSSIPFANRSPKVRFLRSAESHAATESGPCSPIIGGTSEEVKLVKRMKPILKRNQHPILIDVNELTKCDKDELSLALTNDILGNCKTAVDQETQRLYAAERQARGAIDIVTFPSAYSGVEPFSRFLGTVLICIETLDILRNQNITNVGNVLIKAIQTAMQDFVYIVANCELAAKKFSTRTGEVFKQWSSIMKIKAEFYIEHAKVNIPIYPNKTMPENVTLYEDVRDEDERYLYEGVVTLALVNQVVCVWSEFANNDGSEARQCFSDMDFDQQCETIITLIHHAKDLILHSTRYIINALKILSDNDYNEGTKNVRKRISELEFDEYFDPLCGLDLKNSFGEIVERKCELVNISTKIKQNVATAKDLVTKLNCFTNQILKGQKQTKSMFSCCPCCRIYTKQNLTSHLRYINEVAIHVPMSSHFQNIVFSSNPHSEVSEYGDNSELRMAARTLYDQTMPAADSQVLRSSSGTRP